MYKNPFTPAFGSEPMFLAGRQQILEDIMGGLENAPGDPNRSSILIGPRGSGKTVLLAKISEEAAKIGWISTNVTAGDGMLEKIFNQIVKNAEEFLTPESESYISGFQISGIGLTREKMEKSLPDWRVRITYLIEELSKNNIGLLITVDEVKTDYSEMITLVSDFQHFIREKRDVALIMAGLPGNVMQMFQDKNISFVRRAFQHRLGPVNINEVIVSLKKTVEISGRNIGESEVRRAADFSGGYPFLIQMIGYQMWRQTHDSDVISMDDVENGILCAEGAMETMLIDTTINELSDRDLDFLIAMIPDETASSMGDIAMRMGATASLAGQYRRRLISQGVIAKVGRGKVVFEMPLIKEFLQKHYAK